MLERRHALVRVSAQCTGELDTGQQSSFGIGLFFSREVRRGSSMLSSGQWETTDNLNWRVIKSNVHGTADKGR